MHSQINVEVEVPETATAPNDGTHETTGMAQRMKTFDVAHYHHQALPSRSVR